MCVSGPQLRSISVHIPRAKQLLKPMPEIEPLADKPPRCKRSLQHPGAGGRMGIWPASPEGGSSTQRNQGGLRKPVSAGPACGAVSSGLAPQRGLGTSRKDIPGSCSDSKGPPGPRGQTTASERASRWLQSPGSCPTSSAPDTPLSTSRIGLLKGNPAFRQAQVGESGPQGGRGRKTSPQLPPQIS